MPRKARSAPVAATPSNKASDDPQILLLDEVDRNMHGLLSRTSDLLEPTPAHKDAVLSACRLLHSVVRNLLADEANAIETDELVTEGCDSEQIWGQMEVAEAQLGKLGIAKCVKSLSGRTDTISLVPTIKEKHSKINFDDDDDWGSAPFEKDGEEDGTWSIDDAGFEENEESEDGSEGAHERTTRDPSAKAGGRTKKSKKQKAEEFFDNMEEFVQKMEQEDGEKGEVDDGDDDVDEEKGHGNRRGRATGRKSRGQLEEDMADEVQFYVTGAGEDDLNGVYTRNPRVCQFGIAYTNGDQTLLFERAGAKLSRGSVARSRWLLFNDEDGVHGSNPYYQSYGTFANGLTGWKCVRGAAPAPSVAWAPEGEEPPVFDEDDEEDSESLAESEEDGTDADKAAKGLKFADFFGDQDDAGEDGDMDEDRMGEASDDNGEGGEVSIESEAESDKASEDDGSSSKQRLQAFIPADAFQGSKSGYVFKAGAKGLGYYFDGPIEEEAESESDADGAGQSRHQQALSKMSKQVDALEEEIARTRDWSLMGEASSGKRPANSLLEMAVEFDRATKQAPAMTQEFTDSLEDMIKRRCLEGRWDDVVRKAPLEGKRRRVEEEELDMEKSREGLGEVYAREFAKQFLGAKDEDKKAARHAEVKALLDKAFAQLDALSNFHFTPKAPVQDELSVRPNVPAVTMEEVLPMGVSDQQLQAPEEVYQAKRKRTELLGAGDKDSGDAKRMRANKKRKKRDANKRREAAARARGEAPAPRLNKGKQETTKGGRESAGREEDSAGHKAGDLGKSSTLFRALQAEAMGAVHGKTRDDIGHSSGAKGKKGKGGSSKLKL